MFLLKLMSVIFTLFLLINTYCYAKPVNNTLPHDIFVALSGTEFGIGDINSPVSTLVKAIKMARKVKNKPVNIWLREGNYNLNETIILSEKDSRLLEFPLSISSYKNEKVNITGAKPLPYWNKVVSSTVLKQLPNNAKNKVYVTNLTEYGITNYGSVNKGVSLFYNDKKMQLARYPNSSLLTIDKLVEPNSQVIRSYKGSKAGKFYYNDNSIERWANEPAIWLHGYWFWDWKDQRQRVEKIDSINKVIELYKPYHVYGYRKGQNYYAYNILAELDNLNEWFLDRESGKVYLYSDHDVDKTNPPIIAIVNNLVELNNTNNITLKNLTFAFARNNGIRIKGGKNNYIKNVIVKHIGNLGVEIRDSQNSSISSSELFSIGGTAISIFGGDRNKLISANICVINNKIHDYATVKKTYHPGVSIGGVGNCIKNNEIYNAPHFAIYFEGNNHLIAYNKIHDVVKKSNDAGAIYAGRDWSSRGTIIKHNFLYNIKGLNQKGAKGIYLDDEFSGVTITGNIFDNVYDPVFIGGGRDNIVKNNLFVSAFRSLYIDDRGTTWAKGQLHQLTDKLDKVQHQSDIWKKQYPKLANVLSKNPRLPVGNVVKNNVFFDQKWNFVYPKVKPYVHFENNHYVADSKPTDQYQIIMKLNGFTNIPFNNIGIMK